MSLFCPSGHGSLQNSSPALPWAALASDRHGHGVPAHEQPAPGRTDVPAGAHALICMSPVRYNLLRSLLTCLTSCLATLSCFVLSCHEDPVSLFTRSSALDVVACLLLVPCLHFTKTDPDVAAAAKHVSQLLQSVLLAAGA